MISGHTIPVLNNGYVRYIDHLGSDVRVVETARISYKSPSKGTEQDKKLLFFLYKHRHMSPFESCNITFNIKMPIFVMRQFQRHRTFRINEQSARYTETEPDFYIPKEWRSQDTKNKQGGLRGGELGVTQSGLSFMLQGACNRAYTEYKFMLDHGVAKEMARMILPVAVFTEIYVNCDLRNLLNFISLRSDDTAQLEIQEVATAMRSIAEELYPWTFEAFDKFKFKLSAE